MKRVLTLMLLIFMSQAALAGPSLYHVQYLVKNQQYDKAIEKLRYIVRQKKGSFEGWRLLAYSQLKAGYLTNSLKSHRKALKLDANNLELNHSLGLLYIAMDDKTQALAQLEKLRSFCGQCEYYSSLNKEVQSQLGS